MITKKQVRNEQIKENRLVDCVLWMGLNSKKKSPRLFKKISRK